MVKIAGRDVRYEQIGDGNYWVWESDRCIGRVFFNQSGWHVQHRNGFSRSAGAANNVDEAVKALLADLEEAKQPAARVDRWQGGVKLGVAA